jgi:hypothetical protein
MNCSENLHNHEDEEHIVIEKITVKCRGCGDDWIKTGNVPLIVTYRNGLAYEAELNPKTKEGLIKDCVNHHMDMGYRHNEFTFYLDDVYVGFGHISSQAHRGRFDINVVIQ